MGRSLQGVMQTPGCGDGIRQKARDSVRAFCVSEIRLLARILRRQMDPVVRPYMIRTKSPLDIEAAPVAGACTPVNVAIATAACEPPASGSK